LTLATCLRHSAQAPSRKTGCDAVKNTWGRAVELRTEVYDNADVELNPIEGASMRHKQETVMSNFSGHILISKKTGQA